MSQNLVFPSADNKVRLVYTGLDLTQATNLLVQFGSESYDLSTNPTVISIEGTDTLAINLNGTNEKGRVYVTVTYVDAVKTEVISSREQETGPVIVVTGSLLTVEDGSIVDNANSLVTDAEFKQYADLRFVDIPATQPEREALLIKAMDYLFSVEHKLQGMRTSSTQLLPFPRSGVSGRKQNVSSSVIHPDWKKAQMELAIQAQDGDLLESGSTQTQSQLKVDVIDIKYEQSAVKYDKALAYLKPYFVNGGALQLVRV